MNQNVSEFSIRVDKVKIVPAVDQIIQQVDQVQPQIPDSLIKEILGETGFSSNDINSYKLIAHMTDKWFSEMAESMISKKHGQERRKKEQDTRMQLTTDDVIQEIEQRGVKLQNPFNYPIIDPELLNYDKISQTLNQG